jgi:DNA-binding response OmpR family regulator
MRGKKILIIDDDQDLRLGLTARLKANGYRVVVATDAITAITVARREAPDVVVLDLGLPAGDRLQVLDRICSAREIRAAMRNVRWTPGRQLSSRSLPIITNS